MNTKSSSNTLITGLAMFSMFFGAGNVVFPLMLGQYAKDQNFWAMMGLVITAVGVPFLGLITMTLFDGDYKQFFNRIGKWPGFLVSAAILLLIGPFGGMPRCIALSHSTLKLYLPNVSLPVFSAIACVIIYFLTYKRTKILDVLGRFLTPALLVSLALIIAGGFWYGPSAPISDKSSISVFLTGLTEGYQTMDLLGAFFFSSVVLACLRDDVNPADKKDYKRIIKIMLKASCIGATLLALTYFGFSYISSFYSEMLTGVPGDEIAGKLAHYILGPYAGIIACLAVSLSCLTTAIALGAVAAEFLHIDLSNNRISYNTSLIATLIITFFVSTLHFTGIKMILGPILQVCYPALIALSIMNIAYKLYGVETVKWPFFTVFVLGLIAHIWN
jgi:LIVCS family branched-chain amino acid:cation transporter